jgi:hypothetical protein
MASHFFMGAINKHSNVYEYPSKASKANKYICPDCKRDVVLRKGSVRIHHFAHLRSEDPCTYYTSPGETQIHKDAKMALKTILENNIKINCSKKCNICTYIEHISIEKPQTSYDVQMEYRFIYNDSIKIADIALLHDNNINLIFEICHKHKTNTYDRPEPWFEIIALELLETINNNDILNNPLLLNCIRNYKCKFCIERERKQDEERLKQIEQRNQKEREEKEERIKQHLIELEEQKRKDIEIKVKQEWFKKKFEITSEIRNNLNSKILKCSKCKKNGSYGRCNTCSKKYYLQFEAEQKIRLESLYKEYSAKYTPPPATACNTHTE